MGGGEKRVERMSTQSVDKQQHYNLSPSEFEELPPTSKLVLQTLQGTDGMTTSQLADEIGLAERTIRYALNRLDGLDTIESRYLLSDPQTCEYGIAFDDRRVDDLLDD